MEFVVIVPAVITAIAATAGAGRLRWRTALVGALAATVGVGLIFVGARDSGVHTDAVIKGVLLSGLLIGALPSIAYYAFGRYVKRPLAVGIGWVIGLVPLYYWAAIVGIAALGLVACPPGSYECPL